MSLSLANRDTLGANGNDIMAGSSFSAQFVF